MSIHNFAYDNPIFRMKCLKLLPVVAVLAAISFSCTDPVPSESEAQTVSLDKKEVVFDLKGGADYVSITTNGSWTGAVSADWISLTPASGSSSSLVTIKATENVSSESRTGTVTITGNSGGSASVTVRQSGKEVVPEPEKEYWSIAQIRALYDGSDVQIDGNYWIKGTVVSNFRHYEKGGLNNNTSQKGIVIQDETAGIQLYCSANNTDFAFGDIVEVDLKGQVLSQFSSLLQVNGIPLSKISRTGSGSVTPRTITAAELVSGDYESQYVAVPDVQVAAADMGKTFGNSSAHTSIGFEAKTGESFVLFTSKYATFIDEKVPSGSGTLKGIANVFDKTIQIIIAQQGDWEGLSEERFSSGPEFVLGDSGASVDGYADTLRVNLISGVSWSATVDNDACSVTPSSGQGSSEPQVITIVYADNPSRQDSLTTVITFTTDSPLVSDNELKFTIEQEPYFPFVSDSYGHWMELPAMEENETCRFISHNCKIDGQQVRSFGMWYDGSARISRWVAYPLYAKIMGSGSRSDDCWDYDPKVPKRFQAQLYKSYGVSGYSRGHQLPSADRLSSAEANEQTFYFTNLTAQDYDFNAGVWVGLENKVREWSVQCDTLYVVTGALADEESGYFKDNIGRPVAKPKAYFKALLRYSKTESADGGYSAVGFYYENRNYPYKKPQEADRMTIDQLEELTGFDFFHNLPDNIEIKIEGEVNKNFWKL